MKGRRDILGHELTFRVFDMIEAPTGVLCAIERFFVCGCTRFDEGFAIGDKVSVRAQITSMGVNAGHEKT